MFVHDHSRQDRIGQTEAVYCEGKDIAVLQQILIALTNDNKKPILFTRLTETVFNRLEDKPHNFDYDHLSATAFLHGCHDQRPGSVVIVCAGSSDIPISREASRTLDFIGIKNTVIDDVGVAGLWRLQERLSEINSHDVAIVAAGMDAAIVSVLGGLIEKPLIAVPTSIGYGVANNGQTALQSTLCSCAQGVVTVNIDNGFGAACAAARILRMVNTTNNGNDQ